jgi:phage shock protein A
MKVNIKEFPICVYGQIERYNDVLSKARCRIFYKYGNRNGTYITDEFAEKLIASLPYVPVKGIYDGEDFTDHGYDRNQGRIYGIVPEQTNFAWEKHLDEDGIEREYACTDVLIFTALYKEAGDIVGKAQSMELYEPSMKYHMAIVKGQRYVVFDDGCFLGLQALGDSVEPCFEGASFYTLQKTISDTIQKIKEYSEKGGQSEVNIKFKLSDSQKQDAIWALLNPNWNEEGEWTIDYALCDVYDDYALAYCYETSTYERVYYTKDDEQDMVELGERVPVFIIDVTESEKNTLDTLRKLNGDTYELVNENLINAEENANNCVELGTKIEELNTTIATLNTEISQAQDKLAEDETNYQSAQDSIEQLTTEVEDLRNYKKAVETQQKEAVIAEYVDKLSNDVIETYKAKIDEYSLLDLDKELAYECKKSNTSIFNTPQSTPKVFFNDTPEGGIEEILSRYKK